MTPEAVNEKGRKAGGRQCFQGILPPLRRSCFLWTLKSGVDSHLSTRHQSEQKNQRMCGVAMQDAGLSLPRKPLFLVAKGLRVCHLGILKKLSAGGTEQKMNILLFVS